jgi:nickel transport protein
MSNRANVQFSICIFQFAIFILVFLCPAFVLAHSMEAFATVEGKTIQGKANFHDGTPVSNADVIAFDALGGEIGRTKTDDQGKFSLAARFRCDHRLLIDTGDGHGAEYTILAKTLPDDLPPHGAAVVSAEQSHVHSSRDLGNSHDSALIREIHADVDALQDQLDQYEHRIRFRDILGGIGFIVGLAGLAYGYYFRGLLRNKTQSREL